MWYGVAVFLESACLTELEPGDKVNYFSLSKESEGILSSAFSFVFLHNGIKAFFYNPWIEFRAPQEHVWLWPFTFLNTDPKRKGEGSEGCFLPQVPPHPRAGCSEFSRLM